MSSSTPSDAQEVEQNDAQAAAQGAAGDDVLEVDPDVNSYADSALGDFDDAASTTSLTSEIFHYRLEHGRTYHSYKDGAYFLPNDEREVDRLDMQHHMFTLTFDNKLFFSPIVKDPQHVLDVGTGSGIWALDFADEYPGCSVIGTDLSPTQPRFVPPNLQFEIDDAEDTWIYRQKFDLIHMRIMAGAFKDQAKVIQSCYEALAPGGWLEFQDYLLPCESDDGTTNGTHLDRWGGLLLEAAEKMERPIDVVKDYIGWMEAAGFVDITRKDFKWPVNRWPKDPKLKELGRWNELNMMQGLAGFSLALLTRGLGWSKAEVDILVALVRKDMRDQNIHSYFRLPVIYGRKPLQPSE